MSATCRPAVHIAIRKPKYKKQTINDFVTHGSEHIELVVGHVVRGGTELCIRLDDLVNSINKISLGGNLAPRADGKHSGLGADAVYVSTYSKQPV